MKLRTTVAVLLSLSGPLAAAAGPEPFTVPDYVAPGVVELQAKTVQVYDAPEADQGVAADATHFYAIDNTVIAQYAIDGGNLVARWVGPAKGLIRHLNSCFAEGETLWCANSNYSLTPMGSSVERFDTTSMRHAGSHSLGLMDEGSLTWFGRLGAGWIAGFAHYDGNGGSGFKDHRYASVVRFDDQWRRNGGWLMPESVLQRMAPHAASGGAIGPDGLLYLLGHDRPEMYVVAKPNMGPSLIHLATISLEAEGQAFCWAAGDTREIYSIDRRRKRVRRIALPNIGTLPEDARRFSEE